MKKLRAIIVVTFLIILSILIFSLYDYLRTSNREIKIATIDLKPKCGTKSLNRSQAIGKIIFNENCAACHHVMKEYVGANLMKIDSMVFIKWISKNDQQNKKSVNDTKFGITYHQTTWSNKLSITEIQNVYEYCKYFENN